MVQVVEDNSAVFDFFYPIRYGLAMLARYGWYYLFFGVLGAYIVHKLTPVYKKWKDAREDAEYHKDPDKALARMEAVQRARELQQQRLEEASQRALELQREREEQKRQEMVERLQKYGAATSAGQRLGADDDYLPLSGGAHTSSYRPPKKSKCGGGGCGK